MVIRKVARPMLAAAFVSQGVEALRSPINAGEAARPTVEGLQKLPDAVSANVPRDPELVAKVTAAAQIGGGLLLASGRVPRVAAAVLAATVIPANLGAHMFWNEADPVRKARQRRDFMVDVSLLGGLLIASADTAGKPSLSWRGRRAAQAVTGSVAGALATVEGAAPVIEQAGKKGLKAARKARKAGAEVAENAVTFTKEHGGPLVDEAKSGARRLARR